MRMALLVLAAAATAAAEELRFTEQLRRDAGARWDAIVSHRFGDEIAECTISQDVLRRYLVQDHRFVDTFVVLLASAIAAAPTLKDRIPGAQFLGLITSKENTYFERSLAALGLPPEKRETIPDAQVTVEFQALMRRAAHSGSFGQMLAVLVAAEWSYLSWSERVEPKAAAEPFWCREWIDLHTGEYFSSVVAYLRELLDFEASRLTETEREEVRARFLEAVSLESRFFDAAYLEPADSVSSDKAEL